MSTVFARVSATSPGPWIVVVSFVSASKDLGSTIPYILSVLGIKTPESVSQKIRKMFPKALSLSYNWSYVLLQVVYERILRKILRDKQVKLTVLEGRTRPVSTHRGCWLCTTITTIWKRTLHLRFTQGTRKIIVQFDLHEWGKKISLVPCLTRRLTASRLWSPSTYKLNAQKTHVILTLSVHQLIVVVRIVNKKIFIKKMIVKKITHKKTNKFFLTERWKAKKKNRTRRN